MSAPVVLVTKPTAAEQIKTQIVEENGGYRLNWTFRVGECPGLALERAQRGEFTSVVLIWERADGKWGHSQSGTLDMSSSVGRLEIMKASWIAEYEAENSGKRAI
jgi:hypothetical protein